MNKHEMHFGKNLRRMRDKWDMSQEELATVLWIHRSLVSKLETGKRLPSRECLARTIVVSGQEAEKLLSTRLRDSQIPEEPVEY
jgi:predicted transcriptional regulator